MYYEVVSDRDVFVDGIGLLKANEPMKVTEYETKLFEGLNGRKLAEAKFPSFVKTTLHMEDDPPEE